jgi:predicted DNA-binding protein with PD1-like motif
VATPAPKTGHGPLVSHKENDAQPRTGNRPQLRRRVDHDEDFFPSLAAFCRDNNVQQGYIPFFIAGFAEVNIVGTCEKLDNSQAPVRSHVHLTNVEAVGAGTVAYNPATEQIEPHLHVAVGLKALSAAGHTSHLLSAKVQLLTEMIFVEVIAPGLRRQPNPQLYDVPLLNFGSLRP